jgi:hypothetical protein
MRNLWIICVLGIVGIGISSCDEDCTDETNIDCPNYDPCYGVEKQLAIIELGTTINDGATLPPIRFEGDTVIYGGVYFKTNIEDAISYKWTVGTDNRTWDKQEFSLVFNDDDSMTLRNNPILVTLIVERQANSCFPNDDGIDTLSKYLHFRSNWESKVWGIWEGYRDSLNDIYQLEVRIDRSVQPQMPFPHPLDDVLFIYNQYNEGSDCYHWYSGYPSFMGYRNLKDFYQGYAWNWETCGGPYYRWNRKFNAEVNTSNDKIVISWEEWKYNDDGSCCTTIPHTFRGHRIQ